MWILKYFWGTDCIENIVEKGEIAHFEQFHLFPPCFPKVFYFNVLKWVYVEERVNQYFLLIFKTFSTFSKTYFNLLICIYFMVCKSSNLDSSKILLFGLELYPFSKQSIFDLFKSKTVLQKRLSFVIEQKTLWGKGKMLVAISFLLCDSKI